MLLVWLCGRVPDLQSGGCGFESQPGLLRTKVYSAFHPFRVGKWVPAAAGKAKAGMAHSDCGWMCGCAGKTVKSLENTCHTWALLRWWFTMRRRYIKCMQLYFTLRLRRNKGTDWLDLTSLFTPSGAYRPQTKCLHPRPCCTAASTCRQFIPVSCISLSKFIFLWSYVLRCPSGFQYRLFRYTYFISSQCTEQPFPFCSLQLRWCRFLFSPFQSSSLSVLATWYSVSYANICLWKPESCWLFFSVSFHVFDAYINMFYTLELNNFTLVRLRRTFDLHTFSMVFCLPKIINIECGLTELLRK